MNIPLQSALKFVGNIIHAINPELNVHMLRTAYIAQELALTLKLSVEQQCQIFLAAIVHDIGVLGDRRVLSKLDDIDNADDPHQERGYEMLKGFKTFKSIRNIIRKHHFSEGEEGSLEQYVVYFADCFDRVVPVDSSVLLPFADRIIEDFKNKHGTMHPDIFAALVELSKTDFFWFRLNSQHIHRVLDVVSPLNRVMLNIEQFKDICILIARIIDHYSSFTVTHSITVGYVAGTLAKHTNLSDVLCKKIEIAGYLHDIGKVYIPIDILEKKGSLTAEEFSILKEHSYKTGELLSQLPDFTDIANWASNHHEKLNGRGYPFHMNASIIDLPSRIITIADIFTALTEERPYRPGMGTKQALDVIESEVACGLLDDDIYKLLKNNIDEISVGTHKIRDCYKSKYHIE